MKHSCILRHALTLTVVGLAPFVSHAKTCTWGGAGGAAGWNTPSNWEEGEIPEDGDDVILNAMCFFDMPNGVCLRSLTFVKPASGSTTLGLNCGKDYKLGFQHVDGVTNIRFAESASAYSAGLNVQVVLSGAISVEVPTCVSSFEFRQTVSDGATPGSLVITGGGGPVTFKGLTFEGVSGDNTFTGGIDTQGPALETYVGSGFGTGKVSFGPVAHSNNYNHGSITFRNATDVTVPNEFDFRGTYGPAAFFVSAGGLTFDGKITIGGNRSDKSVNPKNTFVMTPVNSAQGAATYTFNKEIYNTDYNAYIGLKAGVGSSFVCNGKVAGNSGKPGASGYFEASSNGTVTVNAGPGCPGQIKVNNYTLCLGVENIVKDWNSCVSFTGTDPSKNILDLGGFEQYFWYMMGSGHVRGAPGSKLLLRHYGNATKGVGRIGWSLDGNASFKFATYNNGSIHTNDWYGGTCTSTGTIELAPQQSGTPFMDSRLNLKGAMSLPNITEIRVGPTCWLDIGADVAINRKARLVLTDDGEQRAKLVIPANKVLVVRTAQLNGNELTNGEYTKATLPNNIEGDGTLRVGVVGAAVILR